MNSKLVYICLLCFFLLDIACAPKRSKCPAYMEIGAMSMAEEGKGIDPNNIAFIQVKRDKKTGLIKGKKRVKGKKNKSREISTDRAFKRDPLMFPKEADKK